MDNVKSQAVVETVFVGPTNHKPSRVRVKHLTTGKRVFVSWEPGLDPYENHKRAAESVLGSVEWYASVQNGGYLFGCGRGV